MDTLKLNILAALIPIGLLLSPDATAETTPSKQRGDACEFSLPLQELSKPKGQIHDAEQN